MPMGTGRGLMLALLAALLDQACASTSVLVYAQHLLHGAGVASQEMQDAMAIAVGMAKFVGVAAGLLIVNRVGRRLLLGWGAMICTMALAALAAGAACKSSALLLSSMCVFVLVFCATWGIGYWVVVTEVTAAGGPRYAAASQAMATVALFATGWATSLTFVSVTAAGGPWALLAYAGVMALAVLYAVALLPETRGHALEDCAVLVQQTPVEAWVARRFGAKAGALGTK